MCKWTVSKNKDVYDEDQQLLLYVHMFQKTVDVSVNISTCPSVHPRLPIRPSVTPSVAMSMYACTYVTSGYLYDVLDRLRDHI